LTANAAAAEETVKIITGCRRKAVAFTADVSRAAEVEAMSRRVSRPMAAIDVLDNNVGIAEMGSVVEVTEAEWDRVFAVNLKKRVPRHEARHPRDAEAGRRLDHHISSIASIRLSAFPMSAMARGKAAMNQMTRTTAVEFARDHVRVNTILPGLMKTPMVEHSAGLAASYAKGDVEAMWRARDAQVPMGHMGDAWDVANAALFSRLRRIQICHRAGAGGRRRCDAEGGLALISRRPGRASNSECRSGTHNHGPLCSAKAVEQRL